MTKTTGQIKVLDSRVSGISLKLGNDFINGAPSGYNETELKMLLGILAVSKNKIEEPQQYSFDYLYLLAGKSLKERRGKKYDFITKFLDKSETSVISKKTYSEDGKVLTTKHLIFEWYEMSPYEDFVTIKIAENDVMRDILDNFEYGNYTQARLDIIHSLSSCTQVLIYLKLEQISGFNGVGRVTMDTMKELLGEDESVDSLKLYNNKIKRALYLIRDLTKGYMDIKWEVVKKGKEIVRIDFWVKVKSSMKKKEKTKKTYKKQQPKDGKINKTFSGGATSSYEEDLELINLLKGSM